MPNDPIFQFYEEQLDEAQKSMDFVGGYFPLAESDLSVKTATTLGAGSTTGAVSSVYFPVGSSALTDFYSGCLITFSDAPSVVHQVTSYTGSSRLATFSPSRASAATTQTIAIVGQLTSGVTRRRFCHELGVTHEALALSDPGTYMTTVTSIAAGAGDVIEITRASHGLTTGDIVLLAGFTGVGAATLNYKTFQITQNGADPTNKFSLDGTTFGSLTVAAGYFKKTGVLLYGSPTNTEVGPFDSSLGETSGAVFITGAVGGLDFSVSTAGVAAVSKRLGMTIGNTARGLYCGAWVKFASLPAPGSTTQPAQLFGVPYTTTKMQVELKIRNDSGTYYLDYSLALTGLTVFTTSAQLVGLTAGEWCFAGGAVTTYNSPQQMSFFWSPSTGYVSATAAGPSTLAFSAAAPANCKNTVGYTYQNSVASNFLHGHLAGLFFTGVSGTPTGWVLDPTRIFTDFVKMSLGQVPPGRKPVSKRTLFSPQNLRI